MKTAKKKASTEATMPVVVTPKDDREYIVVADRTSEVLKSSTSYSEVVKFASMCRKAGGEVTIFRSTRG